MNNLEAGLNKEQQARNARIMQKRNLSALRTTVSKILSNYQASDYVFQHNGIRWRIYTNGHIDKWCKKGSGPSGTYNITMTWSEVDNPELEIELLTFLTTEISGD